MIRFCSGTICTGTERKLESGWQARPSLVSGESHRHFQHERLRNNLFGWYRGRAVLGQVRRHERDSGANSEANFGDARGTRP